MPKDKRFVKYKIFMKRGKSGKQVEAAQFEKDRPSIIVQSGGSTGKAKSIIHTEYNFNSSMAKEAYTDLPLLVGYSMHIIAIPPFIIYGLNNSIYASLVFGLKAQLTPFVSETTVFDDLGKFDIACAAPLHYRNLYSKIIALKQEFQNQKTNNSNNARELDALNQKLEKTKTFISGGDKISAHELLKMEQHFGKPIVNGYGNNEMVGATIISPLYVTKPNSVGIPMKDINVGIFDPETNLKTEDNMEGEICFNSDNFFVGYLNNEEETLRIKQKHSDGSEWIHTGDLGYIDMDGYVYLSGRNKRLIKRKAFKIAPETIESIITNVDEVKDCVVVGVAEMDDDNSSVPMAWVELYPEFCGQFELNFRSMQSLRKKGIMKTEANDSGKSGHASVPLKIHYQGGQLNERIEKWDKDHRYRPRLR